MIHHHLSAHCCRSPFLHHSTDLTSSHGFRSHYASSSLGRCFIFITGGCRCALRATTLSVLCPFPYVSTV
uniref:Uncharacterized protein n=1 Tax=Arundo donax TaxID=35708 RepID=A0A0A8Y462_ARUDO